MHDFWFWTDVVRLSLNSFYALVETHDIKKDSHKSIDYKIALPNLLQTQKTNPNQQRWSVGFTNHLCIWYPRNTNWNAPPLIYIPTLQGVPTNSSTCEPYPSSSNIFTSPVELTLLLHWQLVRTCNQKPSSPLSQDKRYISWKHVNN